MTSNSRRKKEYENIVKAWEFKKELRADELGVAEKHFFNSFLEIALKSTRILDIGAGHGRMIKILMSNGVNAEFYAIDITKNIINSPGERIIADARHLPFKDLVFDLSYSLGVIEHFSEAHRAVMEQARVTAKGGYIIITTPHLSPSGAYKRIKHALRRIVRKTQVSFIAEVGRHLTKGQLLSYIQASKLKVVECRAVPPLTPLSRKRERVERVLSNVLPINLFGSYIYCIAKKN